MKRQGKNPDPLALGEGGRALPGASPGDARDNLDLLNAPTDLIQSIAFDGSILFVNRGWREAMGYDADEIATMKSKDFIASEWHHKIKNLRAELSAGRAVRNHRWVFVTKPGNRIHVEGNSYPRYAGGEIIGSYSFYRDITDRVLAERRLERAQELAELGFWDWRRHSGELFWSSGVFRVFGLDPSGPQPTLDNVYAAMLDPRPQTEFDYEAVARAGGVYSLRYRIRRPDGAIRTVVEEGGPSPDDPTGDLFVGTVRDVTDRIETEHQLLEAQRIAKVGSWRWNFGEDRSAWSAEMHRIFGTDPATFVPTAEAYDARVHPLDRDRVRATFERAVREQVGYETRYRIIRLDGTIRDILEVGEAPEGPTISGVVMDMTERAMIERQLLEAQRIAQMGSWDSVSESDDQWWSDQMYELLGYRKGEVVPGDDPWYARTHPDDLPLVRQAAKNAHHVRGGYDLDYRVRLPDGSLRYMQERGLFVDGRLQGTLTDIIERKRAERNQAHAQHLAQTGSWEYVDDGDGQWWSAELYRILGLDPATPPTDDAWDSVIYPDDVGRVRATYETAKLSGASYTVDYRIVRPDGDMRHVSERGVWISGQLTGTLSDVTERAVIERQMLDAQRIAQMGSWDSTSESEDHWWSDQMYELLGYQKGAVIPGDESWYARIHPEDRQRVRDFAKAIYRDRSDYVVDYRIRLPDRRLRYMQEQGVFLDGRLQGTLADVTERKRVERNLAEAQRLAQTASWEHYEDTDRQWWSPEMYRILGLDPATAPTVGACEALIHPDDLARVRSVYAAPQSSEGYTVDYRIIRPDGKMRHVSEHGAWISGQLTGTLSDVTERNRQERHMQAAQRIGRTGSLEYDLGGSSTYWSEVMYDLLGLPRDTPPSDAALDALIHPQDREHLIATYLAASDKREPYEVQYRLIRPDGRERVMVERAEWDGDRAMGTLTDITERAALESQLRQSQKMEAIGQLTGGVAHDFNNMLGVIIGNLDLLSLRLTDSPKLRTLVEKALNAAESGAGLTRRLLAFARQRTLSPEISDFNELLRGLVDLLGRSLGHDIELVLKLAPDLPALAIDRAQLENAVLNLCINARDAMPEGGRITITTLEKTVSAEEAAALLDVAPGAFIAITVADTGHGMPPEVIERIFEPFYTTKETGKGTGLGLSMVYGFVKQSKGKISVESRPGQGTSISLLLPAGNQGGVSVSAETIETSPQRAGVGDLILVVEDNSEVGAFVISALIGLGYRTAFAKDGASGLRQIENTPEIALVLSDINMPGQMSGHELLRQARLRRPDLKVILMSGQISVETVNMKELGANTLILPKPFRVRELAAKLSEALGTKVAAK